MTTTTTTTTASRQDERAATLRRLLAPLKSREAANDRNAAAALRQRTHALKGIAALLDTEIATLDALAENAHQCDGRNPLWPTVADAGHLMEQLAEALGYEDARGGDTHAWRRTDPKAR